MTAASTSKKRKYEDSFTLPPVETIENLAPVTDSAAEWPERTFKVGKDLFLSRAMISGVNAKTQDEYKCRFANPIYYISGIHTEN